MNRLFLLFALFCMVGCVSTIQSRIGRYPDRFQKLPEKHKSLVQQGQIVEGMGQDAVFLAWGTPHEISRGSEKRKPFESWIYQYYEPIWDSPSVFIGSSYSYNNCSSFYGRGTPIFHDSSRYVPQPYAKVTFRNDAVVRWEKNQ